MVGHLEMGNLSFLRPYVSETRRLAVELDGFPERLPEVQHGSLP